MISNTYIVPNTGTPQFDVTIVSCFYLLEKSKYKSINYIYWLINFFKIKTPKVMFTDRKTYDKIFFNLKENVNITFHILEIEHFKTSKLLSSYDWLEQQLKDHESNIHSIELYKIWNEKSEFLKKAIDINTYSSGHTEAIITEDKKVFKDCYQKINSGIILNNASTQFADGGEFGFGSEIGISTDKLHVRGPVGSEHLTSFKYVIQGNGQVRS